jgi:DivIVA domain-containing protein
MAGEHRIVISSEPTLSPDEIAAKSFATSFRGYDANEVRTWLARVAKELRTARERERELQRLLDRAQEVASHPALDEDTLTAALGEETARVLRSAREAATDITMKAEEKAARLVREAQETANRLRTETEQFVAQRMDEANQAAAAIVRAGEADADGMRSQAKADVEAEVESARARGKEMVAEAMAVRERILADLSRRRRLAHAQIEQLRAGRERLLDAYRLVRRTLDEVTSELTVAEAEARAAAETAARRVAAESETTVEDLEQELALARDIDLSGGDLGAFSVVVEPVVPVETPAPEPATPADEPEPAEEPVGTGTPAPAEEATRVDEPTVGEPAAEVGAWKPERRRSSSLRLLRRTRTDDAPQGEPQLVALDAPHPDEAVRVVPAASAPAPAEATEADEATETAGAEPSVVDDLFARIAAERAALDEPSEAVAPVVDAATGEDDTHEEHEEKGAGETEEAAGTAASEPATDEADEVAPGDDADEQARTRRDELLDPIEAALTRKLKRALQDEQNELLDTLRTERPRLALADALPPLDQARRYTDAAAPTLADAFRAGAAFAAGPERPSERETRTEGPPGAEVDADAVDERSETLATAVTTPLRERIERALEEAGAAALDEADLADRVNAAYRDVRAQRLERAARDAVTGAFCAGAFAATPEGAVLRWVVDSDGEPCPDAYDNALAGPTRRGEPYPTGQAYPPAHAGCRCLLLPAEH